jgi:hypothetical protein
VLTWKLFSQLSAPLIARWRQWRLCGCSHYSFQPAAHMRVFSSAYLQNAFLISPLRSLGKTAAMPLAKGRSSIQRELVEETLANETAVLWQKLFASVSNVGKERVAWAAIIRTVDLFVAVLTCSCKPNLQLQLG